MTVVLRGKKNKNKIVIKEYKWVPGSKMRGDANKVMKELTTLFGLNAQQLKPEHVVQAARNPKSYLHNYFTWDMKAAHEKLLKIEAQKILRSLDVVIVVGNREPITVKAIPSIPDENLRDSIDSYYTPVEEAVADVQAMDRLEKKALADLRDWRSRNAMIHSLTPLFTLIDQYLATP